MMDGGRSLDPHSSQHRHLSARKPSRPGAKASSRLWPYCDACRDTAFSTMTEQASVERPWRSLHLTAGCWHALRIDFPLTMRGIAPVQRLLPYTFHWPFHLAVRCWSNAISHVRLARYGAYTQCHYRYLFPFCHLAWREGAIRSYRASLQLAIASRISIKSHERSRGAVKSGAHRLAGPWGPGRC
ncbi:hypothetical protein GY45DRAFT_778000 [Cubamyces sp. BRFM 1775]|nr:hypothetical protein GY45DRAFT_778000 [Cubamyces sp. BRFM 1775]